MASKLKELRSSSTKNSTPVKETKSIRLSTGDSNGTQPEGKVLSRDSTSSVEEIENGFLLTENIELRIQVKDGDTTWWNTSKKTYYPDNPLKFKEDSPIANFF